MPVSNPTFLGTAGDDSFVLSGSRSALLSVNGVSSKITADTLTIKPLGGADTVQLGFVPTSAVGAVRVDLAGADGQADGQADTVVFNGSDSQEVLILSAPTSGEILVKNFNGAAATTITGRDASDTLVFNLNGGNDIFDAHQVTGGAPLVVHAGNGDDNLTGFAGGNSTLDAGGGQDQLSNAGNDVLLGGDGEDDFFINFDKGGVVTVDGGGGAFFDEVFVNAGLNAGAQSGNVVASASGGHLLVSGGATSIDAVNLDRLTISTFDGADTIQVGDLTSTGVKTIDVELKKENGLGPDGATDTVVLATPAGSSAAITLGADGISLKVTYVVNGTLVETVNVTNMDASDTVSVDGTTLTLADLTPALTSGDFLF